MTYLMQVKTTNTAMQLKTEVDAASISDLKTKAQKMIFNLSVSERIELTGKTYRIYKITNLENGEKEYKVLKTGKFQTFAQ